MNTSNALSMFESFNPFSFDKHGVGYDGLFDRVRKYTTENLKELEKSYPPYNIKKVDENKYVIEMAIAGFTKSQVTIELDGSRLLIKGQTSDDDQKTDSDLYFYRGIANRAFTRSFTLADNVEVKDAEMLNGMLRVWLEHMIPQDTKKTIDIKEKVE